MSDPVLVEVVVVVGVGGVGLVVLGGVGVARLVSERSGTGSKRISGSIGAGSLTATSGPPWLSASDSPEPIHHHPTAATTAIITSQSQIGRRRFRRLLM